MKHILAIALSVVLIAALLSAQGVHSAMANVAGQQSEPAQVGHSGLHHPDDGGHAAESSVCQFYCTATVAMPSADLQFHRIGWLGFRYGIGPAMVVHGAAPDVPERPPKRVFV